MSHTVEIKTECKELEMLKRAFVSLGWEIKENAKMRSYDHNQRLYKYVAVNPDKGSMAYDLGINVRENGEAYIEGDLYGGSVAKSLGQDMGVLKQAYGEEIIRDEFLFQGAQVTREVLENGEWVVNVDFPG